MPMDLCLFSNSPDPIVPVFGTSSAKVTEWVSHQPNPFDKSGVMLDIIFYIYIYMSYLDIRLYIYIEIS